MERESQATPTTLDSELSNAQGIARLSEAFETSARRWELIIYPSLFAFVILAAYGFFLVYRLAGDVHYLALSVDSNMSAVAANMQQVSTNMNQLTDNVRSMTVSMDSMEQKMATLDPMLNNMTSIDQSMRDMNQSTRWMTVSTHNMQYDINRLNNNIGRPMGFMNSFMPW